MTFRDDLAAAHARIEALERENAELRAEIDRLTGRVRVEAPHAEVCTIGEKRMWIGARIQAWQFPYAIYTGETVDDECILRRANLRQSSAQDFVLAPRSDAFVARIGDRVIAQLADLRLVAIPISGDEITSVQLSERLIARPFVVESWLACVTSNGELLHVDRDEWRVTGSEPYRASVYPLPSGNPDACSHRFRHELTGDAGWNIVGLVHDGTDVVLALERDLGDTEMAIARAPAPKNREGKLTPAWITRIDSGDPTRLYVVDGLAVVHSSGIPTQCAGAVDRRGTLQFKVEGALSEARLRFPDGSVYAI